MTLASFIKTSSQPLFITTLEGGISREIWLRELKKKSHFSLFLKILINSIDNVSNERFTSFDPQTTSNCCHGLSLITRELLLTVRELDLPCIKDKAMHTLNLLSSPFLNERFPEKFIQTLDPFLLDLVSIRTLTMTVTIDPARGRRTRPQLLKSFSEVGTHFCEQLIKILQKKFSNITTNFYQFLASTLQDYPWIGGTLINEWTKYIYPPYLYEDTRAVLYASSLFSMQTCLASIEKNEVSIAVINDLLDKKNLNHLERFIALPGKTNTKNLLPLLLKDMLDPIIIFSGYSYGSPGQHLHIKMNPWLSQFSNLILACDTHYPQFPRKNPHYKIPPTPIQPKEPLLQSVIDIHEKIRGVTSFDPSLFCLSHIYVASKKELSEALSTPTQEILPPGYISHPE